jgi:hypothetical protein
LARICARSSFPSSSSSSLPSSLGVAVVAARVKLCCLGAGALGLPPPMNAAATPAAAGPPALPPWLGSGLGLGLGLGLGSG